MKHLFRIKRILIGIIFVEIISAALFCGYFIILSILPRYHIEKTFIITSIVISLIIILISVILFIFVYLNSKRNFETKQYNHLFIEYEPKISLEYMKNDLTIHNYISKMGVEESILKSALFHFFCGNFEYVELILGQINENYFDRIKKKDNMLILYWKLNLLMIAHKNDKEEYLFKYTELIHRFELNPKLKRHYPSQRLDDVLKTIFEIYSLEQKSDIFSYIDNHEFSSLFEKYSITAFLLFSDYKIPTYLKDQFNSRMNSLFINLIIE